MKKTPASALPAVALLFVAVTALVYLLSVATVEQEGPAPAQPAARPSASVAPLPEAPVPSVVRFVAAGDNLIHDNIYQQAAARAGGADGYDFAPAYAQVGRLFEGADLCFINQETIIADTLYPLSGYPQFNSPSALGRQVLDLGFDVVNLANNHMLDMGEDGLIAAMDFWESKPGVLSFGAWRREEDMNRPLIAERNKMKIAFIPVTEHTNGLKLPVQTPLRYILSSEEELMRRQVELARQEADFVVLSIHWGTENSLEKNDNQLELAQRFADWGVDLVLGHHSHTLQPMEWRTGASGNRTLVVYSLGNFISSMSNPQNMLGGVLDIDLTQEPATGEVSITRAEMIPVVTHYDGAGRRDVRVYPLSDYTEALLARHGVCGDFGYFSMDYLNSIVKQNIPLEFRPRPAA